MFKKMIKRVLGAAPGLKETAVRVYRGVCSVRYLRYALTTKVDPRLVVFESYLGRKYSCSPRALFEAMASDPAYDGYEKVWMMEEPEKYRFLEEEFPGTRVVRYKSAEFYRTYARAGYWITNYILPDGVRKREGQTYVQCWHGTPLKKIGCDVPRQQLSRREQKRTWRTYDREGKEIDYMISPSPFYSKVVHRAFRLRRQAKIVELGYPRNDDLFTADADKIERIRKELALPEGKKVILYAPTWRERDHVPGEGYVWESGIDLDRLQEELQEEAVILFRAHYFVTKAIDFSKYEGFLYNVSDYDEINDLYLVSDMLVTDYSSVFFDYANLERPILFYMYDYEAYSEEMQNYYFGIEWLPGPVITEKKDISGDIRELLFDFSDNNTCKSNDVQIDLSDAVNVSYREKYSRFNRRFNPHREAVSASVLKEVFHGNQSTL